MRHPARIRWRLQKRGPIWQLDVRHGGSRQRVSTGQESKQDAERWADAYVERLKAELGDPTHAAGPRAAYSVASAVAAFRERGCTGMADGTATMYQSKAGHALRLLGDRDAGSLAASDVTWYVAQRRTEGATDHTIAKELVTLRRVLGFAESEGHIAAGWRGSFPTRFRTGYDPRDRWLTEAEYQRLVAYLDGPAASAYAAGARKRWGEQRRGLWITVACYTGGRESELRRLDWRDVDFGTGFVTLRSAKVRHGEPRRPRHIPLADELRAALEPLRGVGPVFPRPWKNAALMVTRSARAAGIIPESETLNDNDLRRTFASWMLQRGATVKEVADLLGHGSTRMVDRVYGHLARENLIRAVGRLPRFAPADEQGRG